jgi:hypothetical protein
VSTRLQAAVSWRLTVIVLLVASLLIGLAPASEASPRTSAEAAAEALLFEMHQQARTSPEDFTDVSVTGQAPFQGWADLRDAARRWSDVQAAGRCPGGALICHNTPANGGSGVRNEVCCWSRVAENVGWAGFAVAGATPTRSELRSGVRRLMTAYMASSGHRANILNPSHRHIGTSLSLVNAGNGAWRMHSTTVFRAHDGSRIPSVQITAADTDQPAPPSSICPGTPVTRFPDLDPRTPVGAAAGCIGDRGITKGLPDGTFGANGAVTRAQMASFLVRTLDDAGRPAPTGVRAGFRDVSGPHAEAIGRLHAAGIVLGRPDGTYEPNATVSRAQMASFLARAYEYAAQRALPTGSAGFRDIGGSAHEANIVRLAGAGIAAGTTATTFSPTRNVTRGQMALFLTRFLDRYASR